MRRRFRRFTLEYRRSLHYASTRTPHQLRARLAARHAPRARTGSSDGGLDARHAGERSSYRAAMLGAFWGLGHTLSLVVVGAVLVVLRAEMPARVSDLFELFVAVMLVGLGVRAIAAGRAAGPRRPGARASPRPPRAQPRRRDAARPRRPLDAGATAAAGRRGARPGRQRRADGARARHAAVDDGADHLHGALRTRIDARHGGAVGTARLAARAARREPDARPGDVARRRLRRRSRSACSGATR